MTIYYKAYEAYLDHWFYGQLEIDAPYTEQALQEALFSLEAEYDQIEVSHTPFEREA